MSVINNVLKDLETRESRFTPIEIKSVGQRAVAVRDLRPYLLLGLLLLGLILAAWFFLSGQFPRAEADTRVEMARIDNPVELASLAPTPTVEPPAAVRVNQIVGLQIREGDTDMRLEFSLRDKVVVYLKDRGENSFGYHLRNIDSEILAPAISDNPWITDLDMVARDGGIDVNFQTASDILVETRQIQVDGEALWVIDLRQAEVEALAAAPVTIEANPVTAPVEPAPATDADPEIAPAAVTASAVSPAASEKPVVRLEIKSTDPNAKSTNQLGYAVELINSRRYNDADNLLRGLLGGVEDHAAREHLLALYQRQKRNDRFLSLLRESLTRYPADALFRNEYGRALFRQAAYREVIELFDADAELDATQHALLGASYQRLDQHEAAVRHYRLALAQDDTDARNWIGLGISQEHSSAFSDALNSYQTASKLGRLNNRLQAFVDKRSDTLRQVLN